MENNPQEIACSICGANRVSFFTEKEGFSIFRCEECGHGMVHPMPQTTEEIYGQDYFAGAEGGFGYADYDADKEPLRPFLDAQLREAERLLRGSARRMLDVGAATGFFLEIARNRGWEVAGVEISAFAAELARKKGIDVKTGILAQHEFPKGAFDAVTLWDVIEHVEDPKAELSRVREVLAPEGLLIMTTPNFTSLYARLLGKKWHAIVPPEHLHYFTFKSMDRLLADSGFEAISITAPVKSFTLAYVFQTLARWQGVKAWQHVANFLKKHPRMGSLSFPIPLRDNMLVFARKK